MTPRRLGAYVLPGDLVWLERTLRQYYPLIDILVVPFPSDRRGWTGVPIPADAALEIVRSVDTRGIARLVTGTWTDVADPMRADTAQRQAAIDELSGEVDWILQIDNDEYLPHPEKLHAVLDEAERRGIDAVEWPMRVLYRRTRRAVYEVVSSDGLARYDYPGPVAVRSGIRLRDARRAHGDFLRAVVRGDDRSLQVSRDAEPGESRADLLDHDDAIIHNSWARDVASIRQKMASWGHSTGGRFSPYYWFRWLPSPVIWRFQRDLHPFARSLWPALRPRPKVGDLAD
jgi:hypothetical protein